MTEHISTSRIKRFCVRALPVGELTVIADHLGGCPACYQQFTASLRNQRGSASLKFTLAPEFWFRHDHLDYDQLVELANNTLDSTEREIIDVHLKVCGTCQEDVRSFFAVREQTDKGIEPSYVPIPLKPTGEKLPWFVWWRGLAWKPAYAAAILLIAIGLVTVIVVLKRRAANLEAQQTPPVQINSGGVGPTPSHENQAARNSQPSPTPALSQQAPNATSSPVLTVKNREPVQRVENAGAVAALNDGRGTVSVDNAGNVSGLDEIPEDTRREIAEALVVENIKAPGIEQELSGTPNTLRGTSGTKTFKLLSPARAVIISARPSFEWEALPDATRYRVLVGDLKGHEIAKSSELTADHTRWIPPTPLKRGEIYSWAVAATVGGKEILSPGSSAPEMKFKILSEPGAQELEVLKRTRSHLALGVFYAHEGMVVEAESEFQILVRDNPRSRVLKKLLKQIQSWQRR
jgi:hypothetical protein